MTLITLFPKLKKINVDIVDGALNDERDKKGRSMASNENTVCENGFDEISTDSIQYNGTNVIESRSGQDNNKCNHQDIHSCNDQEMNASYQDYIPTIQSCIDDESKHKLSLIQKCALSQARYPKFHLSVNLIIVLILSCFAMIRGGFYLRVDAAGWWSRGTLISRRSMQESILKRFGEALFYSTNYSNKTKERDNSENSGNDLWALLKTVTGSNWIFETDSSRKDYISSYNVMKTSKDEDEKENVCNERWYGSSAMISPSELNLISMWQIKDNKFHLRQFASTLGERIVNSNQSKALFAASNRTVLGSDAIFDLCMAEETTLQLLEELDVCYKCANNHNIKPTCTHPYSLVLLARNFLGALDGSLSFSYATPTISCRELKERWTPNVQSHFTSLMQDCVASSLHQYTSKLTTSSKFNLFKSNTDNNSTTCVYQQFFPSVIDKSFIQTSILQYTSSIYSTKNDEPSIRTMYNSRHAMDSSDGTPLHGAYDVGINSLYSTTRHGFYQLYMEHRVKTDLGLAAVSGILIVVCIWIHTQSCFLTCMGLLQIVLAFPMAYFVYHFILGLEFFPFVNCNAIFVVFALGADDLFVVVDKWKNESLRHKKQRDQWQNQQKQQMQQNQQSKSIDPPSKQSNKPNNSNQMSTLPPDNKVPTTTTEQIAVRALPNAAYAMLITSFTTAMSFFGNSIGPVPAIVCFAIFCGLVVSFDYILNIALVFPALCLWNRWKIEGGQCAGCDFEGKRRIFVIHMTEMDHDVNQRLDQEGERRRKFSNECNKTGVCPKFTFHEGVYLYGDANEEHNLAIHIQCDSSFDTIPSSPVISNDSEDDFELPQFQTLSRTAENDSTTKSMKKSVYESVEESVEKSPKKSRKLIHRLLNNYYKILHKLRYPILLLTVMAIGVCGAITSQLRPADKIDPPFLPESNSLEKHRMWSKQLLSSVLWRGKYGKVSLIWGVIPADNGNRLDPDKQTSLVLDDSFDPSSKNAQSYLLNICHDEIFANGLLSRVSNDYICPINAFDSWLIDQSRLENPSKEYLDHCLGAFSVPVPPSIFHSCIIAWSKRFNQTDILQHDGQVKIIIVRAESNTTYYSTYEQQDEEWNVLQQWLEIQHATAPPGVQGLFFSSYDFWWYDTIRHVMGSAYASVGIALACASIVIFITSRSVRLMVFSGVAILYVIVGATSSLVGFGWTLGLFESILFAILIGIGCDFVIHFGHAYAMHPGKLNCNDRTKFALLHMGPSVIASGITTLSTAIVMMFTEITYFRKFSVMLAMTIIHSFIGSFVVFLVLCDCFGPSETNELYHIFRSRIVNLS